MRGAEAYMKTGLEILLEKQEINIALDGSQEAKDQFRKEMGRAPSVGGPR